MIKREGPFDRFLLGENAMPFVETTVKLSKFDFDYLNFVVEFGEFSSISDYVAGLISILGGQILEFRDEIEIVGEMIEEIAIMLSESDHAYVSRMVESGEFSNLSDLLASLISLQRDKIQESLKVIALVRERLEESYREPGRFVSGDQLLEEFKERARRKGILPS